MNTQPFRLLRPETTSSDRSAWAALDRAGGHVTVWMGHPPPIPTGFHPVIAHVIGHGEWDGNPCWIEARAGGITVADLATPLSETDTAHLIACISDGLAALHAQGFAHGKLTPERITIGSDGAPMLIGSGQDDGTPEEDLSALISLMQGLCGQNLDHRSGSAAELAASLREVIVEAGDPPSRLAAQAMSEERPSGRLDETAHIHVQFPGSVDEVQPDIGPDAKGRGLLDRWSSTGSVDDLTDDQTEAIDASELAQQARQALIAELNQHYGQSPAAERFPRETGLPSQAVRDMILREPPDPLPIPEGIPHGPVHNPEGEVERTAEIPLQGEPSPESTAPGDTTGFTQTASFRRPLRISLMTAMVIGMLAAAFVVTMALVLMNHFNA